jgi:hemerythrin-like domain-containing protein
MASTSSRRVFLAASGATGAALVLGCKKGEEGGEPSVTATEDLMREHGVIRRAIVVYREAAVRLRTNPASLPFDALQKTARLLRSFAEDYHEKKLEEAHLFPAVKKAGGAAADLVDTLIAQHNRGREINDYVIALAATPSGSKVEPLARSLETFARMYEEHAAMEDTIVFPAWKKTMSAKALEEIGDRFEDIEHETFGKDGFDDAVDQITGIERSFGLDLGQFTAPPPNGA